MDVIKYGKTVAGKSFGTVGIGQVTSCPKCGNEGIPYIVGKDEKDYHSGPPYRVKCLKCGYSSNPSEDINTAKLNWNFREYKEKE